MDFEIRNGVLVRYNGKKAKVVIPDGVTGIGDRAFFGCKQLTSVTILDSVTVIGEKAFIYCGALTSVTIPDSLTDIGRGAFSGTRWLESKRESGCCDDRFFD